MTMTTKTTTTMVTRMATAWCAPVESRENGTEEGSFEIGLGSKLGLRAGCGDEIGTESGIGDGT